MARLPAFLIIEMVLNYGHATKQDEAHCDADLRHGYPLFRTIQPAAWSRKTGIHGLDQVELPVYQLFRYGNIDFNDLVFVL